MPLVRRGPGLIGTVARTAVIAGTAQAVGGRVAHRQQERFAGQQQAEYEQQAAAQQAAPPPAEDDKFAQLEKLAELKQQGILTDEEFAAEKAKILGS